MRRNKEDRILDKVKKKIKKKYISKRQMKKRIKNSYYISNIKEIDETGIIYLKSGEVATVIEVKAIDLSLSSKQEKDNFFYLLKSLYQIKQLNLKCYKIDDKINLNNNKINLDKLINEYLGDEKRSKLLNENKELIEHLEQNNFTVSSIYYWVVISDSIEKLDKQLYEIAEILNNIQPKLNAEVIHNRLEIYKFISNLYLENNTLDQLIWSNLPELACPMNVKEKVSGIEFDDKEFQLVTIKNIPPFIDELFLEGIYNLPNVRSCLSIKDTISQEELVRWINSQYQFLLADRNTTKKLSDATELDRQEENFQLLMQEIKNGDEKIKEVSLILLITGSLEERQEILRALKSLADVFHIKLDIPRLRQLETWQSYDITTKPLKDYSVYLPTLTLSAGFPFTKTYFNDSLGYLLGCDLHTDLPVFFDNYFLNNSRTSHNIAIVSSTGGGKSFTMKKMIVNEFIKGTKIFIFDAENEYEKLVKRNGGEYIDLYSKKGGIINPLQIRYIANDDEEESKETDCPLAKHLGFLEAFFKSSFESITEKELIMLISIIEKLYNKKGIFKNTSINTLESLKPEDYPTFTELYDFLSEYIKSVNSDEKKELIHQLDILLSRFLSGTDSYLFDGYTNIDLNNDLIAFNIQELLYSKNNRLINTQILNLLTYLNNNIVSNKINNDKKNQKKHIMIVVDEFHLFIDEDNFEVLKSFGQLARRIRKYSGSLIVSTQSIKDFVGNHEILRHSTAIFNNCQYQLVGMLKEDDLKAYLDLFKHNPLTDTQISFLNTCKQGEFLLNVDSKTRLSIKIEATELEKELMGENEKEINNNSNISS